MKTTPACQSDNAGSINSATVTIKLEESIKFPNSTSTLTTLTLTTSDSSHVGKLSSLFCYKLRSLGYPVFGDVYCAKENMTLLPRNMRNIRKTKLLIVCKAVCVNGLQYGDNNEQEIIKYEVRDLPDKRFCLHFWKERCGGTIT